MVTASNYVFSRMTKPGYRDTKTGTYKVRLTILFSMCKQKENKVFLISTLTVLSQTTFSKEAHMLSFA